MKIIDSHQHVFWHRRDDSGLIADMDEQGIELAWLLTWEIPQHPRIAEATQYSKVLNPARVRPDGSHPGVTFEDLLIAHRAYPGRFVLGYCPNPAMPGAADLFEAACDMHGVRVCGEWKFRMLIDDPRSLELFRAAGLRKAPVVLHLDVPYIGGEFCPKWYGGTVENLERALQACPDTVFIGHAPGFWREISADADSAPCAYPDGPVITPGKVHLLLDKYPNFYADLSAGSALKALRRDPAHAREFVEKYADRLLFARDYYGGDLKDFLLSMDLPEAVQRKVFHENAIGLLDQ